MQRTRTPLAVTGAAVVSIGTALALVFSSLTLGGAGRAEAQAAPTPVATAVPAVTEAQPAVPGVDAQLFARTELYFGSERPGPDVSPREFAQFLDKEITPRFPDGLTLLTGRGQFREADGTIVEETSFVLILFYPYEDRAEASALVEEIRRLYTEQFDQESVLRVDDPRPVHMSF
ncbi:MAG: DUF3574 domain-containing protein [Chloroflexales bacterium]|nr:DUF3574 domain-containing protein [Chloroflexales bacterium]